MTIDRQQPVLVTGATGYVAGWLVKRLLEDGFTVHAAVRDPDNAKKVEHLLQIAEHTPGVLRFFKTDLLRPGSYADAMAGCEVVFHTASPFKLAVRDPEKDLVEPARQGTRNVLETANETPSVKRVLVTSSAAAVYGDCADLADIPETRFSEQHWNTTSSLTHQPYPFSKTQAEKEAWAIADDQSRWDLITLNPSLVIGPGVSPYATSESFNLFRQLGDGRLRTGVPALYIGAVDVRDVAEAHLRAAFTPGAHGRYIISGHDTGFAEIAGILRHHYGRSFPLPTRTLPTWLIRWVGPVMDKSMTRRFLDRNLDYPLRLDNTRSVEELGMTYRPLETSVVDFFQQLVDSGQIKPR